MRSLLVAFSLAFSLVAVALGSTDVLAMAAVLVVATAVLLAARLVGVVPPAPARVPVPPARASARRATVTRQLAPDAPGRPLPRAPGFLPSAA